MAERNAERIQLDFPQLVADVIRQLNLTGTVGLLEFSDQVTPVYIVAQRAGALDIVTAPVTFESAEVFNGQAWSAAANTVLADTGAMAAGTYDLQLQLSCTASTAAAATPFVIEHRNAANAVTLAVLLSQAIIVTQGAAHSVQTGIFGYVIALNERIRILTPNQLVSGGLSGQIFAALRPTP